MPAAKKRTRHTMLKWLEEELVWYHNTKQELRELEEDIILGKRFNPVGNRRTGYNDPTAEKAIALIENRRVQYLRLIVRSIESVLQNLNAEKLKFIELRYWSREKKLSVEEIAEMLHVTPRTLSRWREEILSRLASLIGAEMS